MVRGKVFPHIDDTPENIAKAMFRNDRLRKEAREAKAKAINALRKKVKVKVIEPGNNTQVNE